MERRTTTVRWAPVAIVAVVLFVAAVLPPPPGVGSDLSPLGFVGIDKWLHACGYALLAGTLVFALIDSSLSAGRLVVVVVGLAVGYGLGLELLQLTIPRRQFDPLDLAANTGGVVAVVVGWWFLGRRS